MVAFSNQFCFMKFLYFDNNSIETCFQWSNQNANICWKKCLALNRRHTIISTNISPGYWRICASFGLDEFILKCLRKGIGYSYNKSDSYNKSANKVIIVAQSRLEESTLLMEMNPDNFSSDIWLRFTLRWRHNDHDSVSNHQPHSCLLNRLFRRRSKETSKLSVTGLCAANSPGPVNSPHKGPVARKMFPFDDVIMLFVKGGRRCHHAPLTIKRRATITVFPHRYACGLVMICVAVVMLSDLSGSVRLIDHSVYTPIPWETALQCNAISLWLGA